MTSKSAEIELPPGFRFHPTDEELVNHYLIRKCSSLPISVPIIKEIDLYKFDPWQLPQLAHCGEKEWYFFSPRDRKYPNGSRPNRAAGTGYWKATGADKPIGKPKTLGIKKALVFYAGKAPRGLKTNWIMHEYRLANVDRSAAGGKKNNNLRLDDWVLCRIYNKKGSIEKAQNFEEFAETEEEKKPQIVPMRTVMSDSMPKLNSDSSSSEEHALSPEVQSEHKWSSNNLENTFDFNFNNYMDGSGMFSDDPFSSQIQFQMDQLSPLQDMFMYFQNEF